MSKREPLKHLEIPETLGIGEGGKTLPRLYDYFKQIDDYIDDLLSEGTEGPPGEDGKDGEQGPPGEDGKDGEPGPSGSDAENQFTEEQVADLLALLDDGGA